MTGGGHSLDSNRPGALKQQTIGLLHAIAYLRGGTAESLKNPVSTACLTQDPGLACTTIISQGDIYLAHACCPLIFLSHCDSRVSRL